MLSITKKLKIFGIGIINITKNLDDGSFIVVDKIGDAVGDTKQKNEKCDKWTIDNTVVDEEFNGIELEQSNDDGLDPIFESWNRSVNGEISREAGGFLFVDEEPDWEVVMDKIIQ